MPNGDIGQLIKLAILVPFAFLVPLAILVGRYAVKRQRRQYLRNVLNTLEAASNTKVELIPTFEYALHKYDIGQRRSWLSALVEFAYFSTTAFIFALVGAAGFAFTLLFATTLQADDHNVWTGAQLFLFSGFSGEAAAAYAKLSAGALTLAFLGSYIWSINYLIGRVANFDLSPVSFLRVT